MTYIKPQMYDLKTEQQVTFEDTFGWHKSFEVAGSPLEDWTAWQNDDIATKAETPLTDRLMIGIGNDQEPGDLPAFRVCEVVNYGRYVEMADRGACPDFPVTQPCCASQDGYEWVNYVYSKLDGSLIGRADESAQDCMLTISDTACCAIDINVGAYFDFWAGTVCRRPVSCDFAR